MTAYKKFIIALGILVIVVGVLYALSFLIARPSDTPEPAPQPEAQTVTISGTMACLPHKGDGPSTLECALGLQTDDGSYYELKNSLDQTIPEGTKVEVTGVLTEEPDDVYDTAGFIDVGEIKKQ